MGRVRARARARVGVGVRGEIDEVELAHAKALLVGAHLTEREANTGSADPHRPSGSLCCTSEERRRTTHSERFSTYRPRLSKARRTRVSSRPAWDPVCSSGVRALCGILPILADQQPGPLGPQQVRDVIIVDLQVGRAQEEALACGRLELAALDVREDVADRTRDYTRRLGGTFHGIGLARAGLAVGDDRGVEALHDGGDRGLRGALVHLVLRAAGVEHPVELEDLCVRHRVVAPQRDGVAADVHAVRTLLVLVRQHRPSTHDDAEVRRLRRSTARCGGHGVEHGPDDGSLANLNATTMGSKNGRTAQPCVA
eukprot:scaffold53006_cov65-Phaeocystis_antarctica.AAC.2